MEEYKFSHVYKNYEDKYNAVPMWAALQISMILIDNVFRNDALRWEPESLESQSSVAMQKDY